jgi:hypothetical protein
MLCGDDRMAATHILSRVCGWQQQQEPQQAPCLQLKQAQQKGSPSLLCLEPASGLAAAAAAGHAAPHVLRLMPPARFWPLAPAGRQAGRRGASDRVA